MHSYIHLEFRKMSTSFDRTVIFWQIQSQLVSHSPLHPTTNFQVSNLWKQQNFSFKYFFLTRRTRQWQWSHL